MNDSYRNNNEVEYCFKTKHKFEKNSRFSVTRSNPRPTLYHNYILRIYPLTSKEYYTILYETMTTKP